MKGVPPPPSFLPTPPSSANPPISSPDNGINRHSPSLSPSIDSSLSHPHLLILPLEVRLQIYRYIVISRLSSPSPRLLRPLSIDSGVHRIGYFDAGTILPLLLTCKPLHEEVTRILYGENIFVLQISGLEKGPIAFLESLAPRYVRLLRKVYIRTGYEAEFSIRYRMHQCDRRIESRVGDVWDSERGVMKRVVGEKDVKKQIEKKKEIAISVKYMKQAWPEMYNVHIDPTSTVAYPADHSTEELLGKGDQDEWKASSYHLWKMFVVDIGDDGPRFEFRRIEWGGPTVKNVGVDGKRSTRQWVRTLDQEE